MLPPAAVRGFLALLRLSRPLLGHFPPPRRRFGTLFSPPAHSWSPSPFSPGFSSPAGTLVAPRGRSLCHLSLSFVPQAEPGAGSVSPSAPGAIPGGFGIAPGGAAGLGACPCSPRTIPGGFLEQGWAGLALRAGGIGGRMDNPGGWGHSCHLGPSGELWLHVSPEEDLNPSWSRGFAGMGQGGCPAPGSCTRPFPASNPPSQKSCTFPCKMGSRDTSVGPQPLPKFLHHSQ